MIREFDCCECGRHIVRFGMPKDAIALCAECLLIPGWYQDPFVRKRIDPNGELDHDARHQLIRFGTRKRVNPKEK